MEGKDLNRLKVVLAEKKRTNKWLAEQIGVDQATVSKWCTNSAQPNLENLMEVAKCLELVMNISRNFTDMKLMRDRVVNKDYCEPLVGKSKNKKNI